MKSKQSNRLKSNERGVARSLWVKNVVATAMAGKAKNPTTQTENTTTAEEITPIKKQKYTFMLHDCKTMQAIGKLVSVDYRYGALKACSRINKLPESCKGEEENTCRIWLRRTNTKIIREYLGKVVTLDTPQVVVRQNREIVYTKRPQVKYVKQWVWQDGGATMDADSIEEEESSVPVL